MNTPMMHIDEMPLLRKNTQVHYEGSIDKQGGNADWDWWLYQDERGEWVLMEAFGPGCLYNFVQHRYISSADPLFRFYFDGEAEPRFEIHASEFGSKYPFVSPMADRYIGPVDGGRGPIRVIRSFIPMYFAKSLKITSSIRLEGFDRSKGQGGWGHAIWHSYTGASPIESFHPDQDFNDLLRLFKHAGDLPLEGCTYDQTFNHTLRPAETLPLFSQTGQGSVRSVRLMLRDYKPAFMHALWLHARWDGHEKEDVCCPIGCFFGNEWGENAVRCLLLGMNALGEMYNFFPMPYWESGEIWLENRGTDPVELDFAEVGFRSDSQYIYKDCGYFRSSAYYPRCHTEGADSIIARIHGQGHVVAAVVSGFGTYEGKITCEGDVRIHIDGTLTPQVESDGSESYACYGWGFPTPPEYNPISGYDGRPNSPWCMVRSLLGEVYPFRTELVFGIESGECNNDYMEHSGILFYYGKDEMSMVETDRIELKDASSRETHMVEGLFTANPLTSYYEGDADDVTVQDVVYICQPALEFTCAIRADNSGLRLRRRSDQRLGRQAAHVFVDGQEVFERIWYFADRNEYKRWLDDEFEIPGSYTRGKTLVRVRIEPINMGNGISWNQTGYIVYSLL